MPTANSPSPNHPPKVAAKDSRGGRRALLSLIVLLLAASGCRKSTVPIDITKAQYVGSTSCLTCHQEQAEKFRGSHHDQAMQPATDQTVLGNFADATIEHHGIVSRFFRDGERFMVHTEGPDGTMQDFHIQYVFGLDPLQQYMVELPFSDREDKPGTLPRIQVLRLCWDTHQKEWFYLPPPDVPEKLDPDDDLHWTGIAQRWNNMCADCHSTNYQKNFVPPAWDGHFASHEAERAESTQRGNYYSTFMEVNVSCEACHGPGSVHVELAGKMFPGWSRERGYGLADLKQTAENQIQACAPCHSRRSVVQGGFQAGDNFYDYFTNSLLVEGVYYPDGQVLDEDYVHGSFIQSKMYHKGIRCTDCHDPHTARLIRSGNEVCTSCHQHPAAKYDSVAHHFHKPGTEAAQCVNCHMPATTYMEVDSRRDHSFRIPRPDLSTQLGTPNACTGCHLEPENIPAEKRESLQLYQDWMVAAREGDADVQAELERANQWCDDACEKWYGENRRRDNHFGIAIAAGQTQQDNAPQLLQELLSRRGAEAPAIARATALQVLREVDPRAAGQEASRAIQDDHPLVRASATSALAGNDNPEQSARLLSQALRDPIRSVRTEAARNLLEYPRNLWADDAGPAFRAALNELVDGLEANNDRAGAHLVLGTLAEQQGLSRQAIQHYQTAIAVEPHTSGPRSNLAALLERTSSAGGTASDAISTQIQQLRKGELKLLARDVQLLPDSAPLRYRYGFSLYLDGQPEEALEQLTKAFELAPGEAAYAQAVALLLESMQRYDEAASYARQAIELSGGDPGNLQLLERIQQAKAAAQP